MHTVLVYHSITSRSDQISDEAISPRRFEQQLRWLSRRRAVVPLTETLHRSEKDRLVGISFDDGYRNNLTVALPLLEKFSLPMTTSLGERELNTGVFAEEVTSKEVRSR